MDAFAAYHRNALGRIRKRFGGQRTTEALRLFDRAFARHCRDAGTDDYDDFIAYILQSYYDPMYDYQMDGKHRDIVFSGDAAAILDWYQLTFVQPRQSAAIRQPANC